MSGNYRLDRDFYAPENSANILVPLKIFICPTTPESNRTVTVNYSGIISTGAAGDYFGANSFQSNIYGNLSLSGITTCTALDDIVNRKIYEITDGTSNTILVSEQAGRPNFYILGVKQPTNTAQAAYNQWGPCASYQVSRIQQFGSDGITADGTGGPCTINCNNSQGFYSFHSGGVNSVFCDGSVRFISKAIHPNTLFGIITINGGEIFNDNSL